MVSKIFIVLGIVGGLTLFNILVFAIIGISNEYDRFEDDEAQLKYIQEYNEKRKLKYAQKMSKMQQ